MLTLLPLFAISLSLLIQSQCTSNCNNKIWRWCLLICDRLRSLKKAEKCIKIYRIFNGFPSLTFIMCVYFLFNFLQLPNSWKHIFIQDINCICHALQFDTTQAMLWSVIQYDLVFLLNLLWPWPLTYISIFLLAYRARNVAFIFCNHYLE